MAESRQSNCVNEIVFYREREKLKGHLKATRPNISLEKKTEKQLRLSDGITADNSMEMSLQ